MEGWEITHKVDDETLKALLSLDKQAFSGKDIGSFERCKAWLKVNDKIYTVLKLGGKTIGYINFVPLTNDAFEKFSSGELKDFDLTPNDILPFSLGEELNCLFMSIVIKQEFRDGEAIKRLTNAFKEFLERLKEEGVRIRRILQDCVSIDGIKFALYFFGANHLRNSLNGKLYMVDNEKPRSIYPLSLEYEEINESNLKTAALIQYEIFKDTQSVGYEDYKKSIFPTNRLENKLVPIDFLVRWGKTPVGVVGLYCIDGYEDDIWIDWLGVLPEYRNRGIGTQMLIHIYEVAKAYKKKHLRLYTFAKTYQAGVRIYRKTMQIEEAYHNKDDYAPWMKDADCKVFSTSLHDKRATHWNNKFIDVQNEAIVHERSLELLKKEKII